MTLYPHEIIVTGKMQYIYRPVADSQTGSTNVQLAHHSVTPAPVRVF
jgi:hypothetical protein